MSFDTRVVTITAAQGAIQLPDNKCNEGVQLLNATGSSGAINFGKSKGTFSGTDHSFPMLAGKGAFLTVKNTNEI